MSYAITFDNFTLGYDKHPAVVRLQAEITEGSLTAVVGPNGAGKSTLLKGGAGTLPTLSGSVSLGNIKKTVIAYLPQQSEVDRTFPITVIELVAMGLWHEIGASEPKQHEFTTTQPGANDSSYSQSNNT